MGYGVHDCVYTIGYGYIGYDMGIYDMYGSVGVDKIWDMGFVIVCILLDVGIYDMIWVCMGSYVCISNGTWGS